MMMCAHQAFVNSMLRLRLVGTMCGVYLCWSMRRVSVLLLMPASVSVHSLSFLFDFSQHPAPH